VPDLTASELAELFRARPDLARLEERGMGAVMGHMLELEGRVHDDQALLKKKKRAPFPDSRTSSTPPSQDPRPKPRSLRRRSKRKSGGQPGHVGHRLEPVAQPDHVVTHAVTRCRCGTSLRSQPVDAVIPHQVFDLPHIRLEVTEHRCEQKECPSCHRVTTAQAPQGARHATQYGPRMSAWAVYLTIGHFIPVARTCELFWTLTGTRPSQGWVLACQNRLSGRLDGFIARTTELLRQAASVCCDETGIRFAAARRWLHVCCTAMLTLLLVSKHRGSAGTRALGILNTVRVAIHDNYASYFLFNCRHGLCNAHHQRELIYIVEVFGQRWARRMIRVLLDGKKLKERYHPQGKLVPEALVERIRLRYRAAVDAGLAVNPPPAPRRPKQKGRLKRGKARCLLERLRDREEETLLFLVDPEVPWDNNEAERSLRMAKAQQKVSGGFRTEAGAHIFARCRSYIDTMRKQGQDLMKGIEAAMAGKAWMPRGAEEIKADDKAA
jgi:transposase